MLWQRFSRTRASSVELSERERAQTEATLRESLKTHPGDEKMRARFSKIADRYRVLSPEGRLEFLRLLADFDVDEDALTRLTAQYADEADPDERRKTRRGLRDALVAPRMQMLRRFNGIPSGVKFLVDMRADLLAAGDEPALVEFERDFKTLLVSWFDLGFVELRRITWDAPASLLERLARYEAVHEMRGWNDLKNRLDRDRRCYAFFHLAMPAEPLIFLELALTNSLSESIAPLLDSQTPADDPAIANTAVFYSISNCQRGLDGISFGNVLIKRVVGEVAGELTNIKRFGTLSPLPGFRAWLDQITVTGDERGVRAVRDLLERRGWQRDLAVTSALREPLLRLCAKYLLEPRPGGRARDPVAHFHLSNGASIERINWMADASKRGLNESAGMMVNYLYRLDRIQANQDAYAAGRIEASGAVQSLNDGDMRPQLTDALAVLAQR